MKNFHDCCFTGFHDWYASVDWGESFMPSVDQLLYLRDLLRRRYAYEFICRRKNSRLDVAELGQRCFCVLTPLCFAWCLVRLLIRSGTLADRWWCGWRNIGAWGIERESTELFLNTGETCFRWQSNTLNTGDDGLNGAIIWWCRVRRGSTAVSGRIEYRRIVK